MNAIASSAPSALRPRRTEGALRLRVAAREARTRLAELGQSGCLKLRFPRVGPGEALEAIMVNISGGVVAGDRLVTEAACGAGAALCLATQAAERFYRAAGGAPAAVVETRLEAGAGSTLEWLPQEAILFDGASLRRRLDIAMHRDARVLAVEGQVFGRKAHGERLRSLFLDDRIRVVRDGRVVFDTMLRWQGPMEPALTRAALADGADLASTILLAAPDAERRLDAVRGVLGAPVDGVAAAASAWNGLLVARLLSRDDSRHRMVVTSVLRVLRGTALPRVWQL